jgi:hypothetical protein
LLLKTSVRDRERIMAARLEYAAEMFAILSEKCAAVERLLAAHHGAEVVTEEQIELCVTCYPLLWSKK